MSRVRVVHSPIKKELDKMVKEFSKKVAKVGYVDGLRYRNDDGSDGPYVAQVAATQEFGDPSRGIPARSFLRSTLETRDAYFKRLFESQAKKILLGQLTVAGFFEIAGSVMVGAFKKTITQIWSPALSLRTIYARAHRKKKNKITESLTKPLVDSKIMLNTLSHKVEDV